MPFATSGGSGLGETAKNLQALAPAAKVVDGKKLSAMATEAEIENWVKTFC